MKIIIIGTLPSSLLNFRGELIKKTVKSGVEVYAMASGATPSEKESIQKLGVKYLDYPVQRAGLNPIKDLITLFFFIKTFYRVKPDFVLAYTIKPVIWGGVASRLYKKIKFFGLITGLGFAFQKGNFKRSILRNTIIFLYKVALKKSKKIIFQNPDNLQEFVDNKITSVDNCDLVNGSGVDLNAFKVTALPKGMTFLLIARLLKDKGILEFIEAAEKVKLKFPNVNFKIVGPADPSPNSIPIAVLKDFQDKGVIEYLGGTSDVRPYINDCSVFVLPSYHEGMPRTVLEAMATGRPILTTNVPGCKETVINGRNGWLVEKANVEQLAERMIWFIEHPGELKKMSDESRLIAIEKFDVNKVNSDLLRIMGL